MYGYGHKRESTNLATVCRPSISGQNFDVIMNDTLIHSTAEEHMDDLTNLCKVLKKYGLKLSTHKCQFFKKKFIWD